MHPVRLIQVYPCILGLKVPDSIASPRYWFSSGYHARSLALLSQWWDWSVATHNIDRADLSSKSTSQQRCLDFLLFVDCLDYHPSSMLVYLGDGDVKRENNQQNIKLFRHDRPWRTEVLSYHLDCLVVSLGLESGMPGFYLRPSHTVELLNWHRPAIDGCWKIKKPKRKTNKENKRPVHKKGESNVPIQMSRVPSSCCSYLLHDVLSELREECNF